MGLDHLCWYTVGLGVIHQALKIGVFPIPVDLMMTRLAVLLLFGAVHFVAARAAIKNELSRHVHFSLYFDVGGIIYKAPRFELILLVQNGD